ncbi:hypothetical protein [Muribaculum intestinale]|uniref:hypothetical protein n=1 Tax=Muribaculum intestinale TaxID=1796646 RepID=UPI00261B653A|nr:hypothetical protein [Muribaculum intestinale]
MTDNLDELKKQWQELSQLTRNLEETNRRLSERMARSKVSSTQERLADTIWRWSFIGLVLPVLAPLLHETADLPWWYCALYALFGVVFAAIWWNFANFIRSERLTDMPVAAAIERALIIKLRQQKIRATAWICGIILIGTGGFLIPAGDRMPALIGGGIGLAAGLAIALPRVLANERMARSMVEDLMN